MLYKEKNEIIDWLDKYNIKNYTLKPDETYGYVVDVAGHVYLENQNLIEIPVKFGFVEGYFAFHYNQISSLEFCPQHITGGISCYRNQITSLAGLPPKIRHLNVSYNQLNSLEFAPSIITGRFDCSHNPLKTLQYGPEEVGMQFNCISTQLENLDFMPQHLGGKFLCSNNPLLGDLQHISDPQEIRAYLLSSRLPYPSSHSTSEKKAKI